MEDQPNNPVHGKKLETIIKELVEAYGWEHMSHKVDIRCFSSNPSVGSSLTFLRRTPWARNQVEAMYIEMVKKRDKSQ